MVHICEEGVVDAEDPDDTRIARRENLVAHVAPPILDARGLTVIPDMKPD